MSGDQWSDWIGRSIELHDALRPEPARALAATLNRDDAVDASGGAIQPLWTWLYFLDFAPMREVGPDGHPKRGGFLPPIEHPRRMWAGSRCSFHAPVRLGRPARKISTIASVVEKSGRAGPMVFVTVEHETYSDGALAMREAQDIVYMNIPDVFTPPPPTPAPPADWSEPVPIDPVFLFRFSALTFNGHRIHYDRRYATDVEKYPGLVVHGPLQAILLFDAALRHAPGRTPARFDFRGVRPLFDFDETTVNGRAVEENAEVGLELFTANGDGAVCMTARMEWAAA